MEKDKKYLPLNASFGRTFDQRSRNPILGHGCSKAQDLLDYIDQVNLKLRQFISRTYHVVFRAYTSQGATIEAQQLQFCIHHSHVKSAMGDHALDDRTLDDRTLDVEERMVEKLEKLGGGLESMRIDMTCVNAKVEALSRAKRKSGVSMHESEGSRSESPNSSSNRSHKSHHGERSETLRREMRHEEEEPRKERRYEEEPKEKKEVRRRTSKNEEYNDDILCDVVPMEATHILLGRP
ncbi:hypothetical protein CR513_33949, partial [Mucuna pruriens]